MFDDGDRRYLARTYSASDTARSSNSQATISYWIKFLTNGINQWIFATANSAPSKKIVFPSISNPISLPADSVIGSATV